MSSTRTLDEKAQELLRIADQLAGKGHSHPTRAVAVMLVLGSAYVPEDPSDGRLWAGNGRTGLETALQKPEGVGAGLRAQWQNWRDSRNRASLFPGGEPFRGLSDRRLAEAAQNIQGLLDELSGQEEYSVGGLFDLFLSKLGENRYDAEGAHTTPRPVNDLLVRLADLRLGMVVGDFYAGCGGTLVAALGHVGVPEWGETPVSGADVNGESVFLARVNLLLHGADPALIRHENTLSSWRPTDDQGRNFDRVLSHPPFGLSYDTELYRAPQDLLGRTSRGKSELMMLQQMRASLRPGGRAIMAMAHGPLYRGGPEARIRQELLKRGEVEAVVGIGPNLFPGTGLPACLLVLRKPDPDAPAPNDVLLINAEREVETGRSKNRLEPPHTEKIVRVFRQRAEVPGFSALVSMQELADHSFDLNIRRYVEPVTERSPATDLRAMIGGGVPRGEIDLARERFRAFGLEPEQFLVPRGDGVSEPRGIGGFGALADELPDRCAPAIARMGEALEHSWSGIVHSALSSDGRPTFGRVRQALVDGLCDQLLRADVLDEYEIAGAFARWWDAHAPQIRHQFHTGRRGLEDLLQFPWFSSLHDELRAMAGLRQRALQRMVRDWGERYGDPLTELMARSEEADRKVFASLRESGVELDPGV